MDAPQKALAVFVVTVMSTMAMVAMMAVVFMAIIVIRVVWAFIAMVVSGLPFLVLFLGMKYDVV